MVIPLALKIRDGMVLAVLISNAHPIPTTMEHNVFAQLKINVDHGKYLMEKNVSMLRDNAHKTPNGMEPSVIPF